MNTKSIFPQNIDNLIFCQDITLNNQEIFDTYQSLLSQKKYEESTQYLRKSGVSCYCADLFNFIEDMIYQLQSYLIENPKDTIFYFSDDGENIPVGSFGI